jgi:hypothetical protein
MAALLMSCVVALTLSAASASASDGDQGHARERALAYASYWGGAGAEGCEPTIGADGSIYVTCGTDSPNLPRIGGIQSHQGQEDAYIAKLDPTGRHIIYSTYLGSPGQDEIDAAAVDRHGHVFVSGFAADGFPTTAHAFDRSFNGSPHCCDGLLGDAFVAELSADGSRLLYATFLGGSGPEQTLALGLDHDGSVVITGVTGSADFPTTARALDPSFGGGSGRFERDVPGDAFAAKLDPSGSRLIYCTYLGGSGDDAGQGVALDHAGNAYFTGKTESPDFPTTPGALKPSHRPPAPDLDGYVTKLDRTGRLAWSTFLGGPTSDFGQGIDVDQRNDIYVSGVTRGGFPVTPGAAQPTSPGALDWFVAKLDRSGSTLDWSTYLGGSDDDGPGPSLRVDRRGQTDIVGTTASTDFPTTNDAFQPFNAGGQDLAIVQLDDRGQLRFSSYLGGSGDEDNAFGAPALDARGNLYVSGVTSSGDFPVTPDAIQPTYGGGDIDSLFAKITLPQLVPAEQPLTPGLGMQVLQVEPHSRTPQRTDASAGAPRRCPRVRASADPHRSLPSGRRTGARRARHPLLLSREPGGRRRAVRLPSVVQARVPDARSGRSNRPPGLAGA